MTPPPDGKKSVGFLIKKGDLEMVEANLEGALRLFDQSSAHLRSASQILDGDPGGSFQLSYDAASTSDALEGLAAATLIVRHAEKIAKQVKPIELT